MKLAVNVECINEKSLKWQIYLRKKQPKLFIQIEISYSSYTTSLTWSDCLATGNQQPKTKDQVKGLLHLKTSFTHIHFLIGFVYYYGLLSSFFSLCSATAQIGYRHCSAFKAGLSRTGIINYLAFVGIENNYWKMD